MQYKEIAFLIMLLPVLLEFINDIRYKNYPLQNVHF